MRMIQLTIQDEALLADTAIAGQAGEHLASALALDIPDEWQACDCTLRFYLPNAGKYYRSAPLSNPVSFPLPQALMVPGELQIFLDARKDFVVHRTSVLRLTVEDSPDWCGTGALVADQYEGLLDSSLQEFEDALGELETLTNRLDEAEAAVASAQEASSLAQAAAAQAGIDAQSAQEATQAAQMAAATAAETVAGFEGYTKQESDDRYAHTLTGTMEGETVTLTDAQEGTTLLSLRVCGKTTLSGVPASDAPVTMTGACLGGNVTVTAGGKEITMACPVLYSLPDGTADTVDAVTGETVIRVQTKVLDGTEAWYKSGGYSSPGVPAFGLQNISEFMPDDAQSLYCTHFSSALKPSGTTERIYLDRNMLIAIRAELLTEETVAAFKAWLAAQKAAGTPVTVLCPLYTPSATDQGDTHILPAQGTLTASGGATVRVTYRRDVQHIIDTLTARIEALETQAVNMQIGG